MKHAERRNRSAERATAEADLVEVVPASDLAHPLAAHGPVTFIQTLVVIQVNSPGDATRVAALLGAGDVPEDQGADDTGDAEDTGDPGDGEEPEATSEVPRAAAEGWTGALKGALKGALDAGRTRPRPPPSVLMADYARLEVTTFDGLLLVVAAARTACLEVGEDGRDGGRGGRGGRGERTEAALRELVGAVTAERDPAAEALFRRVLRCSVGAVAEDDLAFVRGVFRGAGSPDEIARVLALVDRYQGAGPAAGAAARAATLGAWLDATLGLAPDGFAVNYLRRLRGGAVTSVAPRASRASTDDLAVGDLVLGPGDRVGVIDRVFNLLRANTRVEVVEVRPGVGLTRARYAVRAGAGTGTFLVGAEDGAGWEARIAAPL